MARGNSRAQSEAGTIKRSETPGRRIRDAVEQIKNTISGSSREDARDILTKPRGNDEKYSIDMGVGRESDKMLQAGKINLIDGTIDGKPIGQVNRGVIDQMGVKSTENYNVPYVKELADREKGYVFATDGKQVYALPHSWDRNDPAGTVGIFKGDVIKVNGKQLEVIGSFDASRRGLQAASLAAGDAMGRDKGVKQTAILLTYASTKEYGRGAQEDTRATTVFNSQTIDTLNKGLPDLGAKQNGVEPYRF